MKRLALCLILPLGACADNAFNEPTAATGFNGASVTITSDVRNPMNDPSIGAEAARLCAVSGKSAEYVSTNAHLDPFKWVPIQEHLFACR